MNIDYGKGPTEYGPGVEISLTGDEIATAIDAYLVAHGVYVSGPRTITVSDELIDYGEVYVDPSGFVIDDGKKISGRGDSKHITNKHKWKCISPGLYDSLYECKKCKLRCMEAIDNIDSVLPKYGCEVTVHDK